MSALPRPLSISLASICVLINIPLLLLYRFQSSMPQLDNEVHVCTSKMLFSWFLPLTTV
jgi:hypothetical protein